jgi:hypothetical protein
MNGTAFLYLVFAWADYEARGGAHDYVGTFTDPHAAFAHAQKLCAIGDEQRDNVQIALGDTNDLVSMWSWHRYGNGDKPSYGVINDVFEKDFLHLDTRSAAAQAA